MAPPTELTITLPADMVELVRRKMKSGEYASASEVIQDGLLALQDREAGVERWLREEVVSGYAEYVADPTAGVPAEDLLSRIKARRSTVDR